MEETSKAPATPRASRRVAGLRWAGVVALAFPCFYFGSVEWWHGYPVALWAPEAALALHTSLHARGWRAVPVLGLVMAIGFAAESLAGADPASAAVYTAVVVLAGRCGACVFEFARGRLAGFAQRRIDAQLLILGASVALASAAFGVLEGYWLVHLVPGRGVPIRVLWFAFVARSSAMFLVGVPRVLPGSQRSWWPGQSGSATVVERVVQPLLALVLSCFLLPASDPGHVVYLVLALLVWAAARLPVKWALAELALMNLLITLLAGAGRGPFSRLDASSGWLDNAVGGAQSFLLVVTTVTVTVSLFVMTTRWQEQAIRRHQHLHQDMLDVAVVGILILSPWCDGQEPHLSHTNRLARELLDLPERDVPLRMWLDRLDPVERASVRDAMEQVLHGDLDRSRTEFWLNGVDGRRRISLTCSALTRSAGGGSSASVQLIDVTDQFTVQHQLAELALHDPLTGLGNRTMLYDRLDYWREVGAREGTSCMLLYADLNGFKAVNDTYGHDAGDEVLVQVATRLESVVRPQDTVVRLGGDEFVVLVPQVRPGDVDFCKRLEERLRRALDAPLDTEWGRLVCTASLGWSLSDCGTGNEALLRQADRSMYRAKSAARLGPVAVPAAVCPDRATVDELERALDQDQFELYVQPLVDLPTGFIMGGEALVRWNHPTRGVLEPGSWLAAAEESDLIQRLGSWVVAESCGLAARWRDLLGEDSPVMHANISARQLGHGTLVGDVKRSLSRSGLPPEKLVIELTETQLDQSPQVVGREIAGLRDVGVQLAADDFGTGYSSLTRLTDMPIDIVKIDRTFVGRITHDERARAVVAALLTMGNELGLEVVAEGVETQRQALDLRRLGCSVAQGYLWSRPVPADTFLSLAGAPARAPGSLVL